MDQSVKGLCQHCKTVIAFAPAQLGRTAPCPVCGVPVRLRAAPEQAVAAAGEGVPVASSTAAEVDALEDQTERRLKRSLLRLGVLAAVVAGVLIGLVLTAEWLVRKKQQQRENRKQVELRLPSAPSAAAKIQTCQL